MSRLLRRTLPKVLAVAVGLEVLAASGGAAAAQRPVNVEIQRAIAAYDAGELERARALLEAAPPLLDPRDAAIRSLYLGLIHFAGDETTLARQAFMRAVILDPSLRIDPGVHSPSRVQAVQQARAVVVEGWRTEATAAEERGDVVLAEQRWRAILTGEPGDTQASERIAAIEAARSPPPQPIRLPPTDSAEVEEVAPDSAAAGSNLRLKSPGQALAMGLIVPGLGEVYAGRPLIGVLAIGGVAGSLAAAFLVENVSIQCATVPVNNVCPPGDVVAESTDRPYFGAGVAAAAGITLLGALDAFFAARRANLRVLETGSSATFLLGVVGVGMDRRGAVRLDWVRIAF